MNNQYILWAILLLAVALVLFFIEIFVPSAGIIGVLAGAALIGGIVLLFLFDPTVGLIGAIVVLAGVPFLLAFAIKLWPNTPIARMLTLRSPSRRKGAEADDEADEAEAALVPIGARGKALTDLRPVGTCLIDGRRIDCLAEGGIIRSGSAVRVIAADGMQVRVREEE